MTDKQIMIDVILNDENNSQPAPFLGWVRIVGESEIRVTNIQTGMQHHVKNYGNQVFALLSVIKNDEIHIEGNFLWGRFYGMIMEDNQ